jgi:hypothetical protein
MDIVLQYNGAPISERYELTGHKTMGASQNFVSRKGIVGSIATEKFAKVVPIIFIANVKPEKFVASASKM